MNSKTNVTELEGKIITKIDGFNIGSDIIKFYTSDGEIYGFEYESECCNWVVLEDFEGDIKDIINQKIINAYESKNYKKEISEYHMFSDYPNHGEGTWVFYNINTIKGYLNFRFLGSSSSGCYGEIMDFYKYDNTEEL